MHSDTGAVEAQVRCPRAHRVDHELDMAVEIYSQLLRAEHDVVAVHTARECLVLHFLSHGARVNLVQTFRWPNECRGRDETGELVDREQCLGHCRLATYATVRRVSEYRLKNVVGPAALAQNADAMRWVFFGGGMRGIGESLVVEVVDQTGESPAVGVLAEFFGVCPHGGLDGQHMLTQRFARRVLVHERQCVGARGNGHWRRAVCVERSAGSVAREA